MPAILTLTMNPALDVATATASVVPAHKLRCDQPRLDPGGGGINVARALHRLGGDVLALFPAGGASGARLQALLRGEQVPAECIPVAGDTRESFTVHETSTGREYRFVLPGPELAPAEWQACLARVAAIAGGPAAPRWIVASGSLPPGVPQDFYARLAREARRLGARMVVDSSGPALAQALAAGVDLVKPSLRELRELAGEALPAESDWLRACRALVAAGRARAVALSLGDQGALLVTADAAWRAGGLEVPVVSTVGAGDSFLAGLVLALARGQDWRAALVEAMAAGAAALGTPGTGLFRPADVQRLRGAVAPRALD